MPLVHDQTASIGDIFTEVSQVLYDSGFKFFTSVEVLNSIQDQYNKLVALLCPISRSTLVPKINSPYIPIDSWLPDFMYVSAIFNPTTNLWLEGRSYKTMKSDYQTYFIIGQPKWFNVVDLRRLLIWPFLPTPTGVLYLMYKARAPVISMDHIPILPHSVASQLLEYSTVADLLEQQREFKKAQIWWDRVYKPATPLTKSLIDQSKLEIKSLSRMDMETVLEPYRWIFQGGIFSDTMWINDETPDGTIDGDNAIFTIAQVPNPTASLLLTKNGQILYEGSGYSLSGRTITFNTGYIPTTGTPDDELRAWYQVS